MQASDMSTTIVIDGGGTSTGVAVVHSGQILARTQLASFKPGTASDGTADLCRALGSWLAQRSPEALKPRYILIGMSGVWGDHESQRYLNAFTDAWMTYVDPTVPRTSVVSDVALVHLAAFGTAEGIVLIAGTGSIAVARTADGTEIRCGGWGPRIDDAGAGFWIGRQALRAVAHMLDGQGASTLLIRPVAAYLRTDPADPDRVAAALRSASIDRCARLAEAVLTYADDGDAVAAEIREHAVASLAALIPPIDAKMGKPLAIMLHGSLFRHEGFQQLLMQRLQAAHPDRPVAFLPDVLEAVAATLTASTD